MHSQETIARVNHAQAYADQLCEIQREFEKRLTEQSSEVDVRPRLSVQDSRISVDCFGFQALAVPRVVREGEVHFAAEYIFSLADGEDSHEVWRLYLTDDGRLVPHLGSGVMPLFQLNNRHLGKWLVTETRQRALDSSHFKPTPVRK